MNPAKTKRTTVKMDKNENGYPMPNTQGGIVGGVSGGMGGSGCGNGNGCGNGCDGGCGNGNGAALGGANNHTCGGTGTTLDFRPLAYVYAPSQMFRLLYSANDALRHGTLFEELYKPKEVYGRE